MKLTKRFYFPDGSSAEPQKLFWGGFDWQGVQVVGKHGEEKLITFYDYYFKKYPDFFFDETKKPEQIEKIDSFSIEGMAPEVSDALLEFESTIEELRTAVNYLLSKQP